jgi:hypothetical protein
MHIVVDHPLAVRGMAANTDTKLMPAFTDGYNWAVNVKPDPRYDASFLEWVPHLVHEMNHLNFATDNPTLAEEIAIPDLIEPYIGEITISPTLDDRYTRLTTSGALLRKFRLTIFVPYLN